MNCNVLTSRPLIAERRSNQIVFYSCTAAFCFLLVAPTQAFDRRTLSAGHVPAAVAGRAALQRLESSKRLNLAIGLPLRDQAGLDSLLAQLYDPASPSYRQWLTPTQFTEQFGPTEKEYEAVIDFATSQGLRVTAKHPNRVVLDVEGEVSQIERAFHLSLQVYQHPSEARTFYAPNAEPTMDLTVPVLHISGLDNYSLPHPNMRLMPDGATVVPRSGSGPGGTYRGSDFRAAYAPGTTLTGVGQSVGLLQFDGYNPNAIANYVSQAALPSVLVTNIPIDGGVAVPGGGNVEVCLDIEMVISMAPGLSAIYVYEAPNPSPWVDLLSRMATDNLAKQLSCSWGGGDPDPTAEGIFQQMAVQGQSFYNASGDSDAFSGSIDFPAESANITQVAGTTLSTTGPAGSYVSEVVWNRGSGVGSSGGISTTYPIPSYQLGISMTANLGSTSMRNIPDVALTGENVYVVYGSGSTSGGVGGTSCAAPLWAGYTALINQQAVTAGRPTIGFLNPTVYDIGRGAGYATNFHDTTSGNNFRSGSPTHFPATTGYDLCTGWGTPRGTNLINTLAGPQVLVPLVVANGSALVNEGCVNGAIDPGETVSVSFGLKNVGSGNTTNLIATLQSGSGVLSPSGPQAYGPLNAGGGTDTRAFSFTASGVCGGTITATLVLQDGPTSLGSVTYSLPLGLPIQSLVQNFDAVSAPALPAGWTTTRTGAGSNWVTSATSADTTPNSAFAAEPVFPGVAELLSPVVSIVTSSARLSFRQNYTLEADPSIATNGYDGGVLEIKIGAGSFTDILAAGGTFSSGGYTRTIDVTDDNPLDGRRAWSGSSGGFITTLVNLPAAAAGQNIQLKWRLGTDTANGFGGSGWYLDSVAIIEGYSCCTPSTNTPPIIDLASLSASATNFALSVTSVLGATYLLEYKNTLADTNWTALPPPVSGTGGPLTLHDTNGATFPSRFYRVRMQ